MNTDPITKPKFITKTIELEQLVKELTFQSIIAVDTESNSLYAYQEQVCLVQFSTPEADYLVDPLVIHDLSSLSRILEDSQIEKVFHAAEYDLICLQRDFAFTVNNIFDTMVASRILGRKDVGLGSILKTAFEVNLDKRYQRANWGKRPLPDDMLHYAHLDTHFLIPLRQILYRELEQKNLIQLAQEDFNRLSKLENLNTNGQLLKPKILDCWKIKGATDLNPKQAAVLHKVCQYRDKVAKELNLPLFKIFSDKTLIAIAEQSPQKTDELRHIPGMSARQINHRGDSIIQAVRAGKKAEPLYAPRNQRPDDHYLERLDAIRRWRKKVGIEMGVPSDVILPRDLMLLLVSKNPTNKNELGELLQSVPWRLEKFGDQIMQVLLSRR
jgi:ribonuclease D